LSENFKKITLLGFMGCGKSTVGKIVAQELKFTFIDVDALIEAKLKMKITDIFKTFGEEFFREVERNEIVNLLEKEENLVLSVGGGAPAYKNTMEIMNSLSITVFINVPFETLWQRIKNSSERPLVQKGKEFLEHLYRQRLPFYKTAKVTVDGTKKPEEVAKDILKALPRKVSDTKM